MRKICCLLLISLCCSCLFAKTKKAVYIIIDGVPADQIERLHTPAIFDIASKGAYARAYTGGEIGGYSQTATISAIGYTNLLTATWYNKHNVGGNEGLKPNYNYWTIFRIAKEQPKDYKTAIYSSWTDNRTVLIGEGKVETNHLKIDYVKDGYDLDTVRFPNKEKDLRIFDIDEQISKDAANGIRKDAPDLSWVYLWYTDDAGHIEGNGTYFDEYVQKADAQVARIWDAVQYREAHFDEEWMIDISFRLNAETGRPDTYLNGVNVEKEIRGMEVADKVSPVATLGFVRRALVAKQQEMGKAKGIVMDGRDIGTVVFPDAELKLFVTASPEVRAKRRVDELEAKGIPASYEEVLENVKKRDYIDSTREESPLRQADDALVLDNSHMTLEEQKAWLLEQYHKAIGS